MFWYFSVRSYDSVSESDLVQLIPQLYIFILYLI